APLVQRPGPSRVDKRSVAVAAVLLMMLIGGGLLFWKLSNVEHRDSTAYAPSKPAINLPLKLERLTATGQSRLVAISPDGRYLAYTHSLGGNQSIWLRQVATSTNVEIAPAG